MSHPDDGLRSRLLALADEWERTYGRLHQADLFATELRATIRNTDSEVTFTAEEVIEIANETSDSLGNLYRIDFINRIKHEKEQP